MVQEKLPSTSHKEQTQRRLQIVYTRKTHERQIFMQELKSHRKKNENKMLKEIKESVGPRWYQALSVPQRKALENLERSIYQDLLEGRAHRTSSIIRSLGVYPRPHHDDLMKCNSVGRDDPKEMLAQLYLLTFGYTIEGKRTSYTLNARLILSAIFYLGFRNLIELLQEKFRPDVYEVEQPVKIKSKSVPPLASPYLEKMVAVLWEKPIYKRPPPAPLPNLDDLNDPYEEEPVMAKPPPPPPPPPPPKKRIPRAVCDALAGVYTIRPHKPSETELPIRKAIKPSSRRYRLSRANVPESKKVYGLGLNMRKKTVRRKKPVAPSTGLANAQYAINGVFVINNKTLYVLGNVTILPPNGDIIHGGFANVRGHCININRGYRERPPASKPDPCDCINTWQDAVFQYMKDSKCYCGHHYDYGYEGTFPTGELPYFMKPTRHAPMQFNYDTIYNLDSKHLLVEKEFRKVWQTDSVLNSDDDAPLVKDSTKKKKKRSSKTCLGTNPTPEDYLRCALRFMRRVNIAARLPDLHLVPELREWMRRRIYGPLTEQEKGDLLLKSTTFWRFFTTLGGRGYGHVHPPKEPAFEGHTTWKHKHKLNQLFRRYTHNYKLEMYRSHAYVTNLLWRTMYQAEMPDKQFRQIFFCYLFSTLSNVHVIQPYSSKETEERKNIISKNRYICLPAGAELLEV